MNLHQIQVAPHVEGFIKVASEEDVVAGTIRTQDAFVISAREHVQEVGDGQAAPRLVDHPIGVKLAHGDGELLFSQSTQKRAPLFARN